MANPRTYIETSIPSFYFETRTEPDMVARRDWTRSWWDGADASYELVTSIAVLDELRRGDYQKKADCLSLVENLPFLATEPAVADIVEAYFRHQLMPRDPAGDSLHLALASYHKCDFLVTWNARHLANANKFGHIRRVNTLLGLYVPTLTTPLELLGGDDEENT